MKPPHEIPGAAEFGLLRAHLAKNGWSQAQITAAIGNNPAGRSRAEIATELKNWLRMQT